MIGVVNIADRCRRAQLPGIAVFLAGIGKRVADDGFYIQSPVGATNVPAFTFNSGVTGASGSSSDAATSEVAALMAGMRDRVTDDGFYVSSPVICDVSVFTYDVHGVPRDEVARSGDSTGSGNGGIKIEGGGGNVVNSAIGDVSSDLNDAMSDVDDNTVGMDEPQVFEVAACESPALKRSSLHNGRVPPGGFGADTVQVDSHMEFMTGGRADASNSSDVDDENDVTTAVVTPPAVTVPPAHNLRSKSKPTPPAGDLSKRNPKRIRTAAPSGSRAHVHRIPLGGADKSPRISSYSCTVCARTFTTSSGLRQHIYTHTGERPYSCDLCDKSFRQRSTLVTHRRLHTGERPYHCPDCGKSFRDNSTLAKHGMTHSGRRPYECGACGATFSQSGNLRRHQRTCVPTTG